MKNIEIIEGINNTNKLLEDIRGQSND